MVSLICFSWMSVFPTRLQIEWPYSFTRGSHWLSLTCRLISHWKNHTLNSNPCTDGTIGDITVLSTWDPCTVNLNTPCVINSCHLKLLQASKLVLLSVLAGLWRHWGFLQYPKLAVQSDSDHKSLSVWSASNTWARDSQLQFVLGLKSHLMMSLTLL